MARILIVEDNADNMELTVLVLDTAGHENIQARDAESGIALAQSENPDLILMDVSLPGMDGLQAIKELKEMDSTRRIPMIALTAHAMLGDEKRFLEAGCDDYISKPIRYEKMLEIIEKNLQKNKESS